MSILSRIGPGLSNFNVPLSEYEVPELHLCKSLYFQGLGNNRFSNARQNVQYYQIFTRHFKNPSGIMYWGNF